MKRFIVKTAAACAAASIALTTGCNLFGQQTYNVLGTYDFSQMHMKQLEEPEKGAPTAVIETDLGTITVVLYPDDAPNTVNNFINRANEGYYDNQPVYYIYEDYLFLTGGHFEVNDKGETTGYNGATDDGKPIPAECSVNLWPLKGAVMAYNETAGYSDSRFFFANTMPIKQSDIDTLKSYTDDEGNPRLPQQLLDAFVQKGSIPGLSGTYTVFAQTINGFDVLDKLMDAQKDPETFRPLTDIMIKKVTVTEYDPEKTAYEFPDIPESEQIAPETETNEG